ncbi:FAD:protein FMN transferase [Roseovarius sp. SCSIO 43702]|uniref:FAD:protein FMN transferase n=1 Tax=Roseovarius sp. SCSIO 43702 TaxID=2823043 RepID=UPI001C73425F|nr:FAD:protein FMN transferase [Roseovarius sp. SCSIO 43702]QYX56108.1 FAD:protein FMN transferase [Roseovarius sp. SCSIO 43702]
MSTISRRRVLTIFAAATALPAAALAGSDLPLHTWQGRALGARATLRLAHADAPAISARVAAEIDRLEDVFSLFRPESALSRLNRQGTLETPPFELLQCLSLAGRVHDATEGRFDPTVQPLWRVHAEAAIAGRAPSAADLDRARAVMGWDGVEIAPDRITLRPGAALTLNGIAQGVIADRIADLLAAEGLDHVLIDTGEFRALGGDPRGGDWPVRLAAGGEVPLRSRALATSAPRGTTFGEGLSGESHILDPKRGAPVPARWREISVSARSAGLADALSTAACLYPTEAGIRAALGRFSGCRLESISRS